MTDAWDDLIVAVASGPGEGARGIVRLSGHDSQKVAERFFTPKDEPAVEQQIRTNRPTIRRGSFLCQLADGSTLPLPCHYYLWPGSQSFTGEPSVEFHLPGSRPLLDAVVRTLLENSSARLARPGEFTLRAFLSGRIDLTRAEAVLGVINASDPKELAIALGQLSGGIARPLEQLREHLFQSLCDLEAGFDFSEEDIEFITIQDLTQRLDSAQKQLQDLIGRMNARTDEREQKRIVLLGLPNAGKSSLFNALAEKYSFRTDSPNLLPALVSNEAGTTRDWLEVGLRIDHLPFTLIDTAGRESCNNSDDTIQIQSQRQSETVIHLSFLKILCVNAQRTLCEQTSPVTFDSILTPWERDLLRHSNVLPVITQWDRIPQGSETVPLSTICLTSSRTGQGLAVLGERIVAFDKQSNSTGEVVASTAIRCRESLVRARQAIERARNIAMIQGDEILIASELRLALDQLGLVTGTVHSDDILHRIFSRFCVGK